MSAVAAMAVLALLAGAWLTRPLWRAKLDERQRRRAANVSAFRQRLAEIDADRAAGLLDDDTAGSLRAELEARLLREADVADAPVSSGRRGAVLPLLLAIFVAVIGGLGYWLNGSWQIERRIAQGGTAETAASGPGAGAALPPGTIEQMVGKLEARLQSHPEDAEGWAMLGRSYFYMERYEDAAKAYAKANELTGSGNPDLLVNEGEALGLARDRDLLGRPQQLFAQALKIAPDHGKALWYAGLAAEQAGNKDEAKTHWMALARQELPDELRSVLDERLAAVGGVQPAAPAPAAAPDESSPPAAAREGIAVRVAVRVKPELAAKIPPGATLFVFAKAASGPPMPLAVYRGEASELPREVRLDDAMAMTPALKMSMFDRWTISARISRSGNAQPSSGDLQGSLTVGKGELGDSALALVVDQVVP